MSATRNKRGARGGLGPKVKAGATSAFNFLDLLEFIFYGLAGLAILGVLIWAGLRAWMRIGGLALAFPFIAFLVVTVGIAIRDAVRRKWSPISIALGVSWVLCVIAAIAVDALA